MEKVKVVFTGNETFDNFEFFAEYKEKEYELIFKDIDLSDEKVAARFQQQMMLQSNHWPIQDFTKLNYKFRCYVNDCMHDECFITTMEFYDSEFVDPVSLCSVTLKTGWPGLPTV